MRSRTARVFAFALGLACLVGAARARAQTHLVASGPLVVEGVEVARLTSVSLAQARWQSPRSIAVRFTVGGVEAAGSLDPESAEIQLRIDRPMHVDAGSPFEVVLPAGAAPSVHTLRGGTPTLRAWLPDLPGGPGTGALREDDAHGRSDALVRVTTPAVLPPRLAGEASSVDAVARGAVACAAFRLYPRAAVGQQGLDVPEGEPLQRFAQRGTWSEVWLARGPALVHGWTRELTNCHASEAGRAQGSPGSPSPFRPAPVLLPRGLRLGAREASRAPWLTVRSDTQAGQFHEDRGVVYVLDSPTGHLSFEGSVLGPRLAYEEPFDPSRARDSQRAHAAHLGEGSVEPRVSVAPRR